MAKKVKKIGILTGGGDCPGLNAVIRAVAKKTINDFGIEILGIKDGYHGLVRGRARGLSYRDVSGILTLGGTILGSSKIANPFRYPLKKGGKLFFKDMSSAVMKNCRKWKIDALVVIGGDGTLGIANELNEKGLPVVGVPKTIDNDIRYTDVTFGFNSAVSIVTEGIDRIHTTAQSHHRVMIMEVMGHNAGWIALHSGVAGGGDIILMPEIPYDIDRVCEVVKRRSKRGNRFSIIVIAEGARPKGGKLTVSRVEAASADPLRLGGVGYSLSKQLEEAAGISTRVVVMGHLQRGGSPTAYDRILASEFGCCAAELIEKGRFGRMVGIHEGKLVSVPLKKVATGVKKVPRNHPLIKTAVSVGTSFGV